MKKSIYEMSNRTNRLHNSLFALLYEYMYLDSLDIDAIHDISREINEWTDYSSLFDFMLYQYHLLVCPLGFMNLNISKSINLVIR